MEPDFLSLCLSSWCWRIERNPTFLVLPTHFPSAAYIFHFLRAPYNHLPQGYPLTHLSLRLYSEPYIPRLLSHVVRHGPENIMKYKSTWHVEHVALPALKAWAAEQEERGVVQKAWEVGTLEESPFYPGWEALWRGRQGF